ncbi:MAG: hypothetical protein IPO58_23230 [Betaproteobacteria bacterium]|nr:hypothetical protein [Betaproteobacteria bacterium]MBK9609187.1 hypothetical protein [Betaproteobacteria bacterium]
MGLQCSFICQKVGVSASRSLTSEARLVELVGIETGGQIHVGRSRNDINATIDRMRVREWCLLFGKRLCLLQCAFLNRAAQHTETVMSGSRT